MFYHIKSCKILMDTEHDGWLKGVIWKIKSSGILERPECLC